MSDDGHMHAWVVAARSALQRGDEEMALHSLAKALAGPCRAEPICLTCGADIEHRIGIWVHASRAHDTHPAVPASACDLTQWREDMDARDDDDRAEMAHYYAAREDKK